MDEILSVFNPLPPQRAFLLSEAKIRGYGGAMGGGKSRTGCETVFDAALDYPGIKILVARQAHTSIIETTKKTMINDVIPPQLIVKSRASGGEDYVQLWNGSTIHFIGLEDPLRWYSSEIGYVFFDECQEIEEDTCLRIITRLRQKVDGQPTPCKAILTFNPSNPGHWLQRWFMRATDEALDTIPPARTKHGFYKKELWMKGASKPIGNAEFIFALATDNIYLAEGYIDTLEGMPEWMRRRYLEGLWEFISGECFFDIDSLRDYEERARKIQPIFQGKTEGDIQADMLHRVGRGPRPLTDQIRLTGETGPLLVWKKPVRDTEVDGKVIPAHRYVLSIDASSGRGRDWSAIQVIDVESFEQVAEMQLKMETGLVAEEAYRLGRIYNNALIVPEITGGWGLAIDQVLKRLRYPRLYTRRIIDRLSQKHTDRTGWDTTTRTRLVILEALETVIREGEFGLHSLRCLNELGTFVYSEDEKAEAQQGCNDDLVMALAIGVKIASDMPRQLKRVKSEKHEPQFAVTGY